jgi:hypothetical protein
MPRQKGSAADGSKSVAGSNVQRPVINPAESRLHNQSALTPDSATNETEKLLDFDGLLEMVRIISAVKEDGRLGGVTLESSARADE